MRFIQFSKAVVVLAAVAVGIFLSVASHAFDWSAGSTLAVACALVGVLSLTGPALILLGQAAYELGETAQRVQPENTARNIAQLRHGLEAEAHSSQTAISPPEAGWEVDKLLELPRPFELNEGLGNAGYLNELSHEKQRELNVLQEDWNIGFESRRRIVDKERVESSEADLGCFVDLAIRSKYTAVDRKALASEFGDAVLAR